MLKDNDKLNIKCFRIYSYEITRRKISKTKNKIEKENNELTISNIYLEPCKQNSNEELIQEGLRNAD